MNTPHDHARPGPDDMLAALAAARAVVGGDDRAAHEYASAGTCPACVAVAGTSLGIKLVFDLAADGAHVPAPVVRLGILDALNTIESQLRAEGN
jgi:hypothetical protein